MVTRYKPSKEALAATHSASEADYERLAVAVVQAITLKQRDIVIRFPYFVKLPEGFPKGILIRKDEQFNYYRAKCFKIADWLFEQGHLAQNAKEIVKSQRSVVNMLGEIERLVAQPQQAVLKEDKNVVDSQEFNLYNDVSIGEDG
jgi:hypothetical protein